MDVTLPGSGRNRFSNENSAIASAEAAWADEAAGISGPMRTLEPETNMMRPMEPLEPMRLVEPLAWMRSMDRPMEPMDRPMEPMDRPMDQVRRNAQCPCATSGAWRRR